MQFDPKCIGIARQRRKLTKQDLAKRLGVSPRSITSYERGDTPVTAEFIEALADATSFPESFFKLHSLEAVTTDNVSFRSMARLSARDRDAALASASIAYEIFSWADTRYNLPEPEIPNLRGEEPETAARIVRREWGLGHQPIANILHLLESKGVRSFSLNEDTQHLDAFCTWIDRQPFVFLNNRKSAERSRFDAAHELAHLVLHVGYDTKGKEVEAEADRFAGEFLVPSDALRSPSHSRRFFGTNDILELKTYWRVSAVAMAYQLRSANMLTRYQYENMMREFSSRGWRRKEPRPIQRERSLLWEKIKISLLKDGLSFFDVADMISIPKNEIGGYLFDVVPNIVRT